MGDLRLPQENLHLHGWRHFFNTELLKGGLTIPQAQAVTGHKSERMTEWYFHFDAAGFVKAKQVQEALLHTDTKKPIENGIVPPETATAKQDEASGKPGRVLTFPGSGKRKKTETGLTLPHYDNPRPLPEVGVCLNLFKLDTLPGFFPPGLWHD
jgi:hypothetical protein